VVNFKYILFHVFSVINDSYELNRFGIYSGVNSVQLPNMRGCYGINMCDLNATWRYNLKKS